MLSVLFVVLIYSFRYICIFVSIDSLTTNQTAHYYIKLVPTKSHQGRNKLQVDYRLTKYSQILFILRNNISYFGERYVDFKPSPFHHEYIGTCGM